MPKQLSTIVLALYSLTTCILPLCMTSSTWAHGWQAPAKAAKTVNPVAMDKESVQRGRKVYWKSCLMCHGPKAQGNGLAARSIDPKPADLVKRKKMHSDGDFYWKIMNGRLPMPGFNGQLSAPEVWDVINFIKSLER